MVSQIIKLKLTGSYAWKQSRPGAHKGGSCELTSESVTGREITFSIILINNKMSADNLMDITDIIVEKTSVPEETATPASTPTQVETTGRSGEGETTDPTPEVQVTVSKMNRLYLNRPKLSGTQRRKLQAQRAAERGGNAPGLKKHSTCKDVGDSTLKPASGTNETPRKRQRSQASTPSTGSKTVQKMRKGEPGCSNTSESDGADRHQASSGQVTYSQALTCFKNADDVSIISVQNNIKGSTVVVSLDDQSLKVIRDRGYKISLGLELIHFRVPGDRRANANAEGNTN
uniref:Uncharacterized protein n=2 Tax=Cacopsylla melanoneura TaxID=428564 RepID=A0A8D8WCA0_9HEMI